MPAYPPSSPYPRIAKATRTEGTLTTIATAFAEVHAGLSGLALPSAVGDQIELGGVLLSSHATAAGLICFDFATLVAGAVVNLVSGASEGLWRVQNPTAANISGLGVGGSQIYTVVQGDISNGVVTMSLRWKVNAGTGSLWADGPSRRAHVWAKNWGPVAA